MKRFMILFLLLLSTYGFAKENVEASAIRGSSAIAVKHKKPKKPVVVYTKIILQKWNKNKNGRFKNIPNPHIPIALAWSESGFNPKARSIADCRGLFQLDVRTAIYICKKYKIKYNKKTIRKDLIRDVYFNIEVGLAALDDEFKAANGNMKRAILSYKCGRGTIQNSLFFSHRQNQLYSRYKDLLGSFS